MSESLILKSQKFEIFKIIENEQLSPQEFIWETVASVNDAHLKVSRLVQVNTNYYFQFDFLKSSHFYEMSPGDSKQIEKIHSNSWHLQLSAFQRWVQNLKREIEAPDVWSAIANEKILSDASLAVDNNTKFTIEENIRIGQNLNEIKQYLLSTQPFSLEQKQYLDARFNYLVDASERLGRKDWFLLVVGTFMNIIIGLALMPNVARELLRIAGTLLKWLVVPQLLR
jgi:hypothetical protein